MQIRIPNFRVGKKSLKKNINNYLILLLMISIISLFVVSSYFNYRYEAIGNEYRNTSARLLNKTNQLIDAENRLKQIQMTLNQTSIDVEKYDSLYLDKVNELEITQTSLEEKSGENTLLQTEVAQLNTLYTVELKSREKFEADYIKCEADLRRATGDLSICRSVIGECEAACPGWDG